MSRIKSARVIVTSPGRNFVTLKIETTDGVTGLGDATLNGRELSVASYLTDHVIPTLIGRDAHRIEDIWQYLYRGAYWRRGPVTMSAIAAVDTALWDIKGKVAGLPVYQLLGGASRDGRVDERMPVEVRTSQADEGLAASQRARVGGWDERPVAQIGRRIGLRIRRLDESAERQGAHVRTFSSAARAASTSENGRRSSRTS